MLTLNSKWHILTVDQTKYNTFAYLQTYEGSVIYMSNIDKKKAVKDAKRKRKQEAYQKYLEHLKNTPAGVFAVINKQNNKMFVTSSTNINSKIERMKVELAGRPSGFVNASLQKDYKELGEEAFEFKSLELLTIEEGEDEVDFKKRIEEKEAQIIKELKPFGDQGYNIRKADTTVKKKVMEKREELRGKEDFTVPVIPEDRIGAEELSNLFWQANIEELKQGYIVRDELYICLTCGQCYDEEIIYPHGGLYYKAKRAVEEHIHREHGSVFETLLAMDKKYTGLSQIQTDLVEDFFTGLSDDVIAKKSGIAKSTVRNHRFRLKEKQKQAKIFLAIMSLVDEHENEKDRIINIHRTPRMLDDRFAITKELQESVLEKYLSQGKMVTLPSKEKEKIVVLSYLANRFAYGIKYTEPQVNEIIKDICDDFVTVRRYMIQYGFMSRSKDCKEYWLI